MLSAIPTFMAFLLRSCREDRPIAPPRQCAAGRLAGASPRADQAGRICWENARTMVTVDHGFQSNYDRSGSLHRQAVHSRAQVPGGAAAGPLAAGETREQILGNYPYLEAEDVDEA
jgi:hypothetical protein